MQEDRFHRNTLLFGTEGQRALRKASATVAGAGGLGSHVIQQLALLGVGTITAIDDEELSTSNKNRYIGAHHTDPVPGTRKVDIARRLVHSIDPSIQFHAIHGNILSAAAFKAVQSADHVFGCVDGDGPRFVLNALTASYAKPYIDLASDVSDGRYGGRIITNWSGDGCLYCLDELDQQAVQRFLETDAERANRESVYGVHRTALGVSGPSVVSLNGVVASLAVSEYMAACTGMRLPKKFINFDGTQARAASREQSLRPYCPYCSQWGSADEEAIRRFLWVSEAISYLR